MRSLFFVFHVDLLLMISDLTVRIHGDQQLALTYPSRIDLSTYNIDLMCIHIFQLLEIIAFRSQIGVLENKQKFRRNWRYGRSYLFL